MRFEIETPLDPAAAFAEVADFGRLDDWDPAVVRSRLVQGTSLTRGAVYRLEAPGWMGGVVLTYQLLEIDPPRSVTYQGGTERVTSTDTITVTPWGTGSRVAIETTIKATGRRWVIAIVTGAVRVVGGLLSRPALRRHLARATDGQVRGNR